MTGKEMLQENYMGPSYPNITPLHFPASLQIMRSAFLWIHAFSSASAWTDEGAQPWSHSPKKAWDVCACISCACSCRVNPWRGSRICPEETGNMWWRRRWSAVKLMGRSCSFHPVEAGYSYSESAGNREKAQKVSTQDVESLFNISKATACFASFCSGPVMSTLRGKRGNQKMRNDRKDGFLWDRLEKVTILNCFRLWFHIRSQVSPT